MPFTPKTWEDFPSLDTPLEASAIIDTEERLSDYADSVAAGGIELGYAQITSNATQTGAGFADVAGLSTTVTVGTRPIVIEFGCDGLVNSSASGIATAQIAEGSTVLTSATVSLTTVGQVICRRVRLTPSAGSHTYKVVLAQVVTGNSQIICSSSDPAYISVIEV